MDLDVLPTVYLGGVMVNSTCVRRAAYRWHRSTLDAKMQEQSRKIVSLKAKLKLMQEQNDELMEANRSMTDRLIQINSRMVQPYVMRRSHWP